jgi:hypothetical protein
MPLPIPHLDDRTFDDLVAEGRSLIPRYSAAWTNFNVSDPGITLMELFAYLVESAIFELDQVPPETIARFLRLVGIAHPEGESLEAGLARALDELEQTPRTITEAEVDAAAVRLSAGHRAPAARAKLAVALLECDPSHAEPASSPFDDPTEAAIVTVVPGQDAKPDPTPFGLEDYVYRRLKERAPVATRIHVVLPDFVDVTVSVTVVRTPGSVLTTATVEDAIARFLDPVHGGADSTGWPFGRAVYRSELFQLLEAMPGVDHVAALGLGSTTAGVTPVDEGVPMPTPSSLVSTSIAFDTTVSDA